MRFTKAFQLIALALVVSIVQVYVMAGPLKATTDPGLNGKPSAVNPPKGEVTETPTGEAAAVTTVSTDSQLLTAKAAAERMPLAPKSATTLGRIFSKGELEARLASGNSFVKANNSFADTFKSSAVRAVPQTGTNDQNSDEDGGSRGTWIAVGVIAAVLTIAIIGLRHDRHSRTQTQ